MLIDKQFKEILMFALVSYIDNHDMYPIRYGKIHSSEFEDIEYGLSPDRADAFIGQLTSDDFNIDDVYIDDILNIIMTYKTNINDWLISGELSDDEVTNAKAERKLLNALIRFIKAYSLQHQISLPCLDNDEYSNL